MKKKNNIKLKMDPKIIKRFTVGDIENLQQAINSFKYQKDIDTIRDDIEIMIYDNGGVKIGADFKVYHSEIIIV